MSALDPAATFGTDARVIGLVGVAHGVSHFFQLMLPPLFPWIRQELGLSYAELGALVAVFYVISGVGQAVAGFIVDRVSALAVLLSGIALLIVSSLLMGFSTGYVGLAVGAAVAGLGNSVFHPADYTLLNRRVSTARLAHAFSAHGLSGNLGYALAPVFLVSIAQLSGSWRTAIFFAAAVGAIVWLVLWFNRSILNDRASEALADDTMPAASDESVLAFMKLPQIWMCFAFFFVSSLAFGGIQAFAPTALNQLYGMPLTLAAFAYTTYMLSSAGGMLLGGFAGARTSNHDRLIAICFIGSGSMSILLGLAILPAFMVLPLMALGGFGVGVANPSRDLMVRAATPKGFTGRVYGTVYSGLDAGMAVAPVVLGLVMDAGHPGWLFITIGAIQFFAIFTAVTVGSDSRRRKELEAAALQA
jgi:MFS family permease